MRKIFTFQQIIFLASIAILVGCGEQKSTSEEVVDSAEIEETVEETRASPLRKIEGKIGDKTLKVQYGSPAVKGRTIWGDLVPFSEVWRTGANEATFIESAQDLVVEGQTLKAGKYSLFTVPMENGDWTVIFNSEWDLEHGHFQYKEENDVLRVTSTPQWVNESKEWLSIQVTSPGLVVEWEKLKLPIEIK
ncbi:DUF2911 domain-containing protein [Lunatibacter salilacus]|uniref:DUF2911 domain-containing protein n=1 Tax=Lunatibacter salilacus TaxID=2483804 RepID=UPI00131DC21E|nr:DUF2911 domain-containing protein [Lunatibacter salilacus]